jgi:hypothetical protein
MNNSYSGRLDSVLAPTVLFKWFFCTANNISVMLVQLITEAGNEMRWGLDMLSNRSFSRQGRPENGDENMFKRPGFPFFIALLALVILLGACSGGEKNEQGSSPAGAGDAERGKALYEQTVIGPNSAPGCATCHSRDPGKVLVGPSHADVGARAPTAVPGMPAEDFLRESIVKPDAHVAEDFPPGIMYQNYGKDLTEQEINDLVAYMITLK